MPILRGSITFARFTVDGLPKPADHRRWLQKGLAKASFEAIDRRSDDERACGFAELENADQTNFSPSTLFFGERALWTFRVDSLKVPGALIRDELGRWQVAFQRENDRKPSRAERSKAKAEAVQALRSKAAAQTKTHDVALNLKTGQLLVWSASRKQVEEITAAIEEALDLKLTGLGPGALGAGTKAGGELRPTPELTGVDIVREVNHG